MRTLLGISNIRIFSTKFTDTANEFLASHDGSIIDVQATEHDYTIIYQEVTVDG